MKLTAAAERGETCAECSRPLIPALGVPGICGRCYFGVSRERLDALADEGTRRERERTAAAAERRNRAERPGGAGR